MPTVIGQLESLYRYPVKSMRGEVLERGEMGWHGVVGDRRLGLRLVGDRGGFPWLIASKMPEMLLYEPVGRGGDGGDLPGHVRTPEGVELATFGAELAADAGRRYGAAVEMMHYDRGIFDEASVSVILSATIDEACLLGAVPSDARRFRPNVVVASARGVPFEEDAWVGGLLVFGEGADAAVVHVTNRDERCSMVNFDPDSARSSPELLRAIVRTRDNKAGVYAAVVRRGRLEVGQPVFFAPVGSGAGSP